MTVGPEPDDAPRPPLPRVGAAALLRALAVGLVFGAVLAALTSRPAMRHCGNVFSRYMTIESILSRGTTAIAVLDQNGRFLEQSPLLPVSNSPDVARFGDRLYSDKPPVLPAIGAVVARLFDLRLTPLWDDLTRSNHILTVSIVGVSSALALAALRVLIAAFVPIRPWIADVLTLAFGFGSLLYVYGVTFNNHSVAAGLITLAAALVALESNAPGRRAAGLRAAGRFAAGFAAALAATIDIPPGGLFLLLLGLWLLVRDRGVPSPAYILGAVGPLALHCALQIPVTGTPLPVEMYPDALAFEGSYWATEEGRWREVGPRWRWGLEFTFGYQGWITNTPILALALPGALLAVLRLRHRNSDAPPDPIDRRAGGLAAVTLAATLVMVWYYVWGVRRCDFAGGSYGTRHMLAVAPLLFLFALDLLARAARSAPRLVFAPLAAFALAAMLVGLGYAHFGMLDPWSRIDKRDDVELRPLKALTLYPHSTYPR